MEKYFFLKIDKIGLFNEIKAIIEKKIKKKIKNIFMFKLREFSNGRK